MDDARTLDHLRAFNRNGTIFSKVICRGRLVVETGKAQSETTTTRLLHEEQLPAMKAVAVAVLRLIAGAGPL